MWPSDAEGLVAAQEQLARATPPRWEIPGHPYRVGGCWTCFARGLTGPGNTGDPTWTAAVSMLGRRVVEEKVRRGEAGAPYVAGLLALRIGPVMEATVRALDGPPDVLLLDASGRDHPRRAGLALHLGAVLDVPTVGVTHRPLLADGEWPDDAPGAMSLLRIGEQPVASWLRTRAGARPVVVHPGWRTDLATAREVVLRVAGRHRTPEPLRRARHRARLARR